MPPCISRLLRSFRRRSSSKPAPARLADVQQARHHMLQSVHDCQDEAAARLRSRIGQARSHKELWMLRSEAYRVISLHHCQSVAVERIDLLMHVFEDTVPWSDSGRPS
ncbi:MAG: hypothetical protein EP308_12925 [Burkholderiales bacterium]|nr:MAG: hypothetical protein EP308_12925 [Burkholderiales bacterium]